MVTLREGVTQGVGPFLYCGSLVVCTPCCGLVLAGFWTWGFDVSPSTVILPHMQGTTCTTLGGVMFLLDKDSSDEEDSSPLLASLGVLVPLHNL